MVLIGRIIKNFRIVSGLKSQELADLCKISRQTLSHIENDHTSPSLDLLLDICYHLEINIWTLLDLCMKNNNKKQIQSIVSKYYCA